MNHQVEIVWRAAPIFKGREPDERQREADASGYDDRLDRVVKPPPVIAMMAATERWSVSVGDARSLTVSPSPLGFLAAPLCGSVPSMRPNSHPFLAFRDPTNGEWERSRSSSRVLP